MPATDSSFRSIHFTWKHRLIAAVSRRFNFTYKIRHGLASGMRRKGGLGFVPWGGGETEETQFLRKLDLNGLVVYDIGAFEGILTMFFSRSAKRVIAYEPNPSTRARLLTNLKLNSLANVTVREVGLSESAKVSTLVYDPLMPGAASSAELVSKQIREHAPEMLEVSIPVVRLDDDIRDQKLPAPQVMKIDVEGMELSVLRGAEATLKEHRPSLFIEMHGAEDQDKRQNALDVVTLLWNFGYHNILHVETGERLTPANTERPSHLYCRYGDA
jgi:FkbM family methyltransferase